MHVASEEERRGVRDRDAPEIRDHSQVGGRAGELTLLLRLCYNPTNWSRTGGEGEQ
jgi:hypothetical protein